MEEDLRDEVVAKDTLEDSMKTVYICYILAMIQSGTKKIWNDFVDEIMHHNRFFPQTKLGSSGVMVGKKSHQPQCLC